MLKPVPTAFIALLVLGPMVWAVSSAPAPGQQSAPEAQPTKTYGGGADWGAESTSNKRMLTRNGARVREAGGSSSGRSDHILSRERDGHFYATATIDSRDFRVMVDTGASIIALTGDDARDMGLDWDEYDIRPIGRGASGTVMGTNVTLASVRIGDLQASHVDAVIIPEGLDVSLLGQSFLKQVGGMRVEGDKMTLGT